MELASETLQPTLKARTKMVLYDKPSMKHLLGWLIAGTKGGVTRAQIIMVLKETPQNANQLATRVKKDYRTIRHHLEILSKHGIVVPAGDRYGTTYFLSPQMEENYALFEEIVGKIWEKPKEENREEMDS